MNVLKHFDVPKSAFEEDKSKKIHVKCMHCAKFISGSLRVTSNFITHMKVRRYITFNIFFSFKTDCIFVF